MSLENRVGVVRRAVLTVRKQSLDRAFTVVQIAFVATLLVLSFQYDPDTQLFPLVVGTTTLGMLVLLLVLQVSGRLEESEAAEQPYDLEASAEQQRERRANLFAVFLWTVALVVLVLLVGFLPGTLVFLVAYYRLRAKNSVFYTVLYSGAVWGFIVVVFDIVLRTRFYTGLFDVAVPFLS